MNLKSLTDKLFETETLLDEELIYLIETDENPAYLCKKADEKIKAYLKKDTLMNMKKEVRQKLMLRAENGYLHIETK